MSIDATSSVNVRTFPPDEEFEPEFLSMPYVLRNNDPNLKNLVLGMFKQSSSYFLRDALFNYYTFYEFHQNPVVIRKVNGQWETSTGIACTALAEIVDKLINGNMHLFQMSFTPGEIRSPRFAPDTYLKNHPAGSCLIRSTLYSKFSIAVQLGKSVCAFSNSHYPDLNRDGPATLTQQLREALRQTDAIMQTVSDTLEQLQLNESFLDLTPLTELSDVFRKQYLAEMDPKTFNNIKHVIIYPEKNCKSNPFSVFVDICIYLAKIDRTDLFIDLNTNPHFDHYLNDPPQDMIKGHLEQIYKELQGEQLNWALDKYIKVLLANTVFHHMIIKVKDISSFPLAQALYNDEKCKPDLEVKLKGSNEIIRVHRSILAMHSSQLQAGIFGKFKDSSQNTVTFDFSDEVTTQFLRTLYSFEPEFENCELFELLHCADYYFSPIFMYHVNRHLNDKLNRKKVDISVLIKIIKFKLWLNIPQKASFFECLSTTWSDLINNLPEIERAAFRDDFLKDWLRYKDMNPKIGFFGIK